MTRKFYLTAFVMVAFMLMSFTCSSDDDDSNGNNNGNVQQVVTIVESGNWSITSFVDSGQDETNDFNGYTFTFGNDGTLTASNGNTTLTGTWSVTSSSSSSSDDDGSSSDIDFNIFFPVDDNHDFEDLNDDWDVVTYSNTTISLIDISGGNGGTDTLVFEQN